MTLRTPPAEWTGGSIDNNSEKQEYIYIYIRVYIRNNKNLKNQGTSIYTGALLFFSDSLEAVLCFLSWFDVG